MTRGDNLCQYGPVLCACAVPDTCRSFVKKLINSQRGYVFCTNLKQDSCDNVVSVSDRLSLRNPQQTNQNEQRQDLSRAFKNPLQKERHSPLLTESRIRADRRHPARLEQGLCHEHPRENDEGPLSPPIQARTCTLSRPVNPFSHTLRSRTVWRNCGTASRTCSCGSTPPRCDTPLSLSFSK
jgi:hypothetical protein